MSAVEQKGAAPLDVIARELERRNVRGITHRNAVKMLMLGFSLGRLPALNEEAVAREVEAWFPAPRRRRT